MTGSKSEADRGMLRERGFSCSRKRPRKSLSLSLSGTEQGSGHFSRYDEE